MKIIFFAFSLLTSTSAFAKVIVCNGAAEGQTLTMELTSKRQGFLLIKNAQGEKTSCELSVLSLQDNRKGLVSIIMTQFVREFQCTPKTSLESSIPKTLDFRLNFDRHGKVHGDFKWKSYSPHVKCEVTQLDLQSVGMPAAPGALKGPPP
ncbi:MAG TPA: hypothetical protein VF412_10555 [Bdellovibrio sp.]|uniref:hypothetical protein n=1 Tax=Bdellovibrio sp. TaxID=28201 RepID=UPI002F171CA7